MAATYLPDIKQRQTARQEMQQNENSTRVLLPPLPPSRRITQGRAREHARHLADLERRMDAREVSIRIHKQAAAAPTALRNTSHGSAQICSAIVDDASNTSTVRIFPSLSKQPAPSAMDA